MGGVFSTNTEEIFQDIVKLNNITTTDLFLKKAGCTLEFRLSKSLIKNIFSNKVIQCQVVY